MPPLPDPPIPWRAVRALERAALARPSWATPREIAFPTGEAPTLRLAALGDVALVRSCGAGARGAFDALRDRLDAADLRTANLEAMLTSATQPRGEIGSFVRAEPAAAAVLEGLGLDVANVANNHGLDFGPEAAEETAALLRAAGTEVCGLRGDDGLARPATVVAKGLRVGFLGLCDDHFPLPNDTPGPRPALAQPAALLRAVRAARPGHDVIVVHLHWGYEFALHPLLRHRDLARRAVEAGADVVLCHHAHVPLAVERWGRGAIAHGLGNGLMPLSPYLREGHPWTDRSFLLEVDVGRGGVCGASLVPFAIRAEGRLERLAGAPRRRLLSALGRMARRLGDDARLGRMQAAVLAVEAIRLLDGLAAAARRGGDALRQRASTLELPRQDELVAALGADSHTAEVAARLRELAAAAGAHPGALAASYEAAAPALEAGAASIRARFRWRDALRSRVP